MESDLIMLKVVYLFLLADGKETDEENAKFDEILKSLKVSDRELVKNSIKDQCRQIFSQSIDESDRFEIIKEEFERILPNGSDNNMFLFGGLGYRNLCVKDFKKLLWLCVNISYADGTCASIEEELLRFIANRLAIDKAILIEMEDSAKTLIALEKKQSWAENCDLPYSVVKSIIDEITQDKKDVIESIELLIA